MKIWGFSRLTVSVVPTICIGILAHHDTKRSRSGGFAVINGGLGNMKDVKVSVYFLFVNTAGGSDQRVYIVDCIRHVDFIGVMFVDQGSVNFNVQIDCRRRDVQLETG